uniref:Venom S1 protease 22 n=1 Tax=Oncocephalus sp. TaxID=2944721 RepID=A0AB38ZEN4_9HEMI
MLVLLLVFSVILSVGSVFGDEETIDYSGVGSRVVIENRIKWQATFGESSAEVDSSEHGVSPGRRKTSCPCGWANRAKGRMIGGKEYARFEYPFTVGVAYSTYPTRPHCGGTIITSRHVLTAAHCTVNAVGPIGMYITLGEHERGMTPGAYTIKVDRLIQHPGFHPILLQNDISLLVVNNHLLMSSVVGPACFPTRSIEELAGTHVRILGWGADRVGGPMKFRPQKLDTRVVDKYTCNRVWPHHVSANPVTQLCTISKNKTPCQGDSGGPVVSLNPETNRYYLVGIVSFGSQCKDNKPSVQTLVSAFKDWIMGHIQETSPGQAVCY